MKMIIKVNKEELKNVSQDLTKSSDSFLNELKIWENSITKLKTIWEGVDADIFYSRINDYLLKLKMLYETTNSIGKIINLADNKYIEKDLEFASDLKKENDMYEFKDTENSNN